MRRSAGLILVSAGGLAFQVTLTRLFAIQQFHHFAFLVISLAVMGFAASGVILSFRPYGTSLIALSLAFSVAIAFAYLIVNFVPFDSYSIAWDRRQIGVLFLYFLSAGTPFLFVGWTIGATLTAAGARANRPYAASFVGSALGVPLALIATPLLGGEGMVVLTMALGVFAAAAFAPDLPKRMILIVTGVVLALAASALPQTVHLRLSPYKPLSLAQLAPDAHTPVSRWGPAARIDVVESGSTHVYPGLSLNAAFQPAEQAALFVDGDGPIPITNLASPSPDSSALSASMPSGLAYRLRPGARALVLRPGAGMEALVALGGGAERVYLAEDEPIVIELLSEDYSEASGGLLEDPRVEVIDRPSRGALREGEGTYDIVHFALTDAYRPVTNGAFSLTENFSLSVEALSSALDRLSGDGLLVLTRWLGTPPSESARAWSTLIAALELEDPGSHLVAFRGIRTATMLAGKRAFSSDELQRVREFLDENAYDPVWLPDLSSGELNQHNRLPEPVYHELFAALVESPRETIAAYDFNLRPPTDDRPYFYHFFRWGQTPAVLATLGQIWQPFGGSGYFVLVALLVMVVALAAGLVAFPSLLSARPSTSSVVYFAAIGAAYLLIEIPLIQQLTLLLDRPAVALALVLFTLLLASGTGSLVSPKVPLTFALPMLVAIAALVIVTLPSLIGFGLSWPLGARLVLAGLPLLPLGFLMGIPFASGLRHIPATEIPWAWAVNGALSGIGGVVAAMFALDFGFRAALSAGALAYFGAWLASRRLIKGEGV